MTLIMMPGMRIMASMRQELRASGRFSSLDSGLMNSTFSRQHAGLGTWSCIAGVMMQHRDMTAWISSLIQQSMPSRCLVMLLP